MKEEIEQLDAKLQILINEEKFDECETTNTRIEDLKVKLKKLEGQM
jgi:hypothetical protein